MIRLYLNRQDGCYYILEPDPVPRKRRTRAERESKIYRGSGTLSTEVTKHWLWNVSKEGLHTTYQHPDDSWGWHYIKDL